ncbi:MAG: 4'-phosphopantetheinyl transferase superfamily protein [Rhodobacteraceae bacterium]|nr:4'-phosphopantetheinyl transferase superfamily protein [Paracoccaceae bacterium]
MTEFEAVNARRLALVRPLFSDDLAVHVTHPALNYPPPLPEEMAGLSPRAVEKRRREFSAGRHAVRLSQKSLGEPSLPVRVGPDRAPIWPDGLVGGVSHTRTCAVGVVGRSSSHRAVSVDVEEDVPLKAPLLEEICLDSEIDWLNTQDDPLRFAKLIFSAKEAAYKAQFPITRTVYGFSGMETYWDLENGRFSAFFTSEVAPFAKGDRIDGRFAIGEGIIVTAAELRG